MFLSSRQKEEKMTAMTRQMTRENKELHETHLPVSAVRAQKIAWLSDRDVLDQLKSSEQGLASRQVEASREKYGSNHLAGPTRTPVWKDLWNSFATPFSAVLLFLAVVSFITDVVIARQKDPSTVIIMLFMILLSGIISFVQARRSSAAVMSLLQQVETTATVTREGREEEVPVSTLVVGDIVHLAAGDQIPADIRLLSSTDLLIQASSLTGESRPVEKMAAANASSPSAGSQAVDSTVTDSQSTDSHASDSHTTDGTYLDLPTICYEGTGVVSGSATGVVFAVGADTVFGSLKKSVTQTSTQTSFQKGISSVSRLLLIITAVITPLVFVINGFTKGNWMDALLFAIATAVGLTPEMLPVIVASNLVHGSVVMSHKGTIVKHMDALQNFGAADVLTTDKTGTLTQGRDQLEDYCNLSGQRSSVVLDLAYLNAFYQSGVRSLTDKAICERLEEDHQHESPTNAADESDEYPAVLRGKWTKVDEIPFDFHRRRLSVIVQKKNGDRLLITKGAVEELLSCSTTAMINGKVQSLTAAVRSRIEQQVERLNDSGRRLLLLATKKADSHVSTFGVEDETDLTIMGYLVFIDPPKQSARQAIKDLQQHNVTLKVLTGDNAAVTRTICRQVGIDASSVITGPQIENMSDEELTQRVNSTSIFAKLAPDQKAQVVAALHRAGHTVAFMGDGINDTPAMKKADVAISVNTAVDVAKETAGIILLRSDLRILAQAVVLGRKVLINTLKYIKITLSSNFGNILSVMVASLFLPFLPMQPLQLLILDVIYGISCIALPFDRVDPHACVHPREWTTKGLLPFMLTFGPVSSLVDIATFAVLFFWICPLAAHPWGSPAVQTALFVAVFNAGWFIESLWTQEMVIHALRDPRLPFIGQRASLPVLLSTLSVCLLGTIMVFTPIAGLLDFGSISPMILGIVAVFLVVYISLITMIKAVYIHGDAHRFETFI